MTLMGLTYQYPIDEIVEDAKRILGAIRTCDLEGAVSAWRIKVDNAARYMMAQLTGPASRNDTDSCRRSTPYHHAISAPAQGFPSGDPATPFGIVPCHANATPWARGSSVE